MTLDTPADRPIVFVDTETFSLGPRAVPWEIAIIRRDPDGAEWTSLLQISYRPDELPRGTSPEALRVSGWLDRGAPDTAFRPPSGVNGTRLGADEETAVVGWLLNRLWGDPVLVGVGVHFDVAAISALLRRGLRPTEDLWHYAIVDLKAATWGYLNARWHADLLTHDERAALELPMASEQLSRAVGVEPPQGDERHTAVGDARWAARWFDSLVGIA